jgi:hypothetical protein
MFVLECLLPCQRNKPPVGKTHVTNPVNNEHLHSKTRELKPYMEKRRVRPVPMKLLAGAQYIFSTS